MIFAPHRDAVNQRLAELLPILEERHELFILEKKRMRSLSAEFYSNRRILAWHKATTFNTFCAVHRIPGEKASWDHLCYLIEVGYYGSYIRHLLVYICHFLREWNPLHSQFKRLAASFGPPAPKLQFM